VKRKNKKRKKQIIQTKHKIQIFLILSTFLTIIIFANIKPTITSNALTINEIENRTWSNTSGYEKNDSGGGGYINVINITVLQQTEKWKAYVGNITGTLELADSGGVRFYDWALLDSLTGNIYVTRNETTPTWSQVNCTWAFYTNGSNSTEINNHNITETENAELSHTNPYDNITATFAYMNHTEFYVGSVLIPANHCWNTNPYINDTSVNNTIYADTYDEILLYERSTGLIYASMIETDQPSYNENFTYDFQVLLPDNGAPGFASSTAYYFYVEVS